MILYETERLIVRVYEDKDANDLFEMCSDDLTNRFVSYPQYTSLDNAFDRINDLKNINGIEGNSYAVELKSENKVVGDIGLVHFSEKCGGIAEVGYQMSSKYYNKGVMTEALKGMIKYLFENNIAMRVECRHAMNNPASGKVMEKAGMIKEGILRKSTSNKLSDRVDLAVYGILKEDYMNSLN